MKYVGKVDTPIAGAEIIEFERHWGTSIITDFEVYINGKFKARFRELAHAVASVCRSFEIEEIPLMEWDLWWDFDVDGGKVDKTYSYK